MNNYAITPQDMAAAANGMSGASPSMGASSTGTNYATPNPGILQANDTTSFSQSSSTQQPESFWSKPSTWLVGGGGILLLALLTRGGGASQAAEATTRPGVLTRMKNSLTGQGHLNAPKPTTPPPGNGGPGGIIEDAEDLLTQPPRPRAPGGNQPPQAPSDVNLPSRRNGWNRINPGAWVNGRPQGYLEGLHRQYREAIYRPIPGSASPDSLHTQIRNAQDAIDLAKVRLDKKDTAGRRQALDIARRNMEDLDPQRYESYRRMLDKVEQEMQKRGMVLPPRQ